MIPLNENIYSLAKKLRLEHQNNINNIKKIEGQKLAIKNDIDLLQ